MRATVILFLCLINVWTGIAIVQARHENRRQFTELQRMEKQRDLMMEDWGRLQLEQATWGTHSRVEEVAREKLEMMIPQTEQIHLVQQ